MKRRLAALAAAMLCVASGLALRRFAGGALAKYGGVALWAALVYTLVVGAAPRWPVWQAAALALAISWAVELFQLTPVPAALAARHRLFHLVLGDTFSVRDLPAYLLGIVLAAAADLALTRRLS